MSQANKDQSKRIENILSKCSDKSINTKTLMVFYQFLNQTLSLPCDVIGKADMERYILHAIDNSDDDMYGLLGKLKALSNEKKEYVIPLCDLKAVDNRSVNFMLLHDYGIWFVNSQF